MNNHEHGNLPIRKLGGKGDHVNHVQEAGNMTTTLRALAIRC